jgi:DNA-binding NtrC family response regulator
MKDQAMPYDIFVEALHDNEVDALKAYTVLVLCDDAECAARMVQVVRKRGLEVMCCSRVSDARSLLSHRRFSLIFSSDTLPDGEVRSVIGVAGAIPVIVLSRRAEWDAYLDALNQGVFDYIACPPDSMETERILTLALSEPRRYHI